MSARDADDISLLSLHSIESAASSAQKTQMQDSTHRVVTADEVEYLDDSNTRLRPESRSPEIRSSSKETRSAFAGLDLGDKFVNSVENGQISYRPGIVLPIVVITLQVALVVELTQRARVSDTSTSPACRTGDYFLLSFKPDDHMDNTAFSIDITFGSFSFGTAKAIDIAWDLIVGRGCQALGAFATYRVFTLAMTRTMETSHVSYGAFRAITLEHNSIFGAFGLAKSLRRPLSRRWTCLSMWMICTVLFLLVAPTWISAMTGYTTDTKPYVWDDNGDRRSLDQFRPLIYTINDGGRLGSGFHDNYQIAVSWDYDYALDHCNHYTCGCDWNCGPDCHDMNMIRIYVDDNGPSPSNFSSFVHLLHDTAQLEPPTLNISMHFALKLTDTPETLRAECSPYPPIWSQAKSDEPLPSPSPMFVMNDTLYTLEELNQKGECLADMDIKYKWGFSFILTLTFLVLSTIWSVALYGIFLSNLLSSQLDAEGRYMGLDRAVLDLAEVSRRSLVDDKTALLSSGAIERQVRRIPMTFTDVVDEHVDPPRQPERGPQSKAFLRS